MVAMSSQKPEIEVSADSSYEDSELMELAQAFGKNYKVRTTRYQRLTGVTAEQLLAILIITFNPISKGFLEEFGKQGLEFFKRILIGVAKKKKDGSEVMFRCIDGARTVELSIKSNSEKVLDSAFEQIDHALQTIEGNRGAVFYFDFDPNKGQWHLNDTSARKIAFEVEGVVATTDPVIVRGEKVQFSEQALKKVAAEMKGTPLLYEHEGPPIGEWMSARYENGKLIGKAGIYEPRDDSERKIVDDVKTRKLKGFSLGFSY